MIASIIDDRTIIYTFTDEDLANQNFNKALSKIRNIANCNVNKKGETLTITLKDKPQNSTRELGVLLDEIREILMGDVIYEYETVEIEPPMYGEKGEVIKESVTEVRAKDKDLKDCPCLPFTPHSTQIVEVPEEPKEPEEIK